MKRYFLRIAVLYFLFASFWWCISGWLWAKPISGTMWHFLNGILFVVASSVIIYAITCWGYNRISGQYSNYKLLFDESPHPILIYDADTLKIIAANPVFFNKYRYTPEDVEHLRVIDLAIPEESLEALALLHRTGSRARSGSRVWKSRSKCGEIFYVSVTSFASTFQGRPVRTMWATDINEEMQAKQALHISERKMVAAVG